MNDVSTKNHVKLIKTKGLLLDDPSTKSNVNYLVQYFYVGKVYWTGAAT